MTAPPRADWEPESHRPWIRRNVAALSAYYFSYFAAVAFISPHVPVYFRAAGFSYTEVGLLLAMASVGGALGLIPVGILSDRTGLRRAFIVTGSLIQGMAYLVMPQVSSLAGLAALQFVAGLGGTVGISVAAALGADVFENRSAGRMFSIARAWGTAGFVVIMVIKLGAPHLGDAPGFFIWIAGFCAVSGPMTLMVKRVRATKRTGRTNWRDAQAILSRPGVRPFVLAYFLAYLAMMCLSGNLSLYVASFGAAAPVWFVSAAFIVSAGIELPGLLVWGGVSDRIGRLKPLRLAFAILPLRLAAYALLVSPWPVLGLQTLHCLTFSVLAVVPFAFMNDLSSASRKATGQSILNAAGSAAWAVGPLLAGIVADMVGIRLLYGFLACIAAAGAAVLFTTVREPEPLDQTPNRT